MPIQGCLPPPLKNLWHLLYRGHRTVSHHYSYNLLNIHKIMMEDKQNKLCMNSDFYLLFDTVVNTTDLSPSKALKLYYTRLSQ